MKTYDDIVVGSGISGMTLALLLGMNGHSVLLLEKGPRIGGSMARFRRMGIPFDAGFHFTGAFHPGGVLEDMLSVLGLRQRIEPVYLDGEESIQLVFEDEGRSYHLPSGLGRMVPRLKSEFPREAKGIDRFFERMGEVCRRTAAMDLRRISEIQESLDEDYVSLDQVLGEITADPRLKGLLGKYCMCHGVKPAEIPFAGHSRVSYGLYESVARVRNGGDAFIDAFRERFAAFDIEVRCGAGLAGCRDIRDRRVGRFALDTGEEVAATRCIFTIHPHQVLELLPRPHLGKAFLERVSAFEPSAGFFSLFGVLDAEEAAGEGPAPAGPSILSLFPHPDLNRLMDPACPGDPPMVVLANREEVDGTGRDVLIAMELSYPEHVAAWSESVKGNRPEGYREYKAERVERLKERIFRVLPDLRRRLRVVESASLLTFRDYLHSPAGSAYGIKQKIGQYNLFGKLPLRNLYAAGQSSVLPGLVGAMMSVFIVCRSILGKDDYQRFILERLRC